MIVDKKPESAFEQAAKAAGASAPQSTAQPGPNAPAQERQVNPPRTIEMLLANYLQLLNDFMEQSRSHHATIQKLLSMTDDPHEQLELFKLISEPRFKEGKIVNAGMASILRLKEALAKSERGKIGSHSASAGATARRDAPKQPQ